MDIRNVGRLKASFTKLFSVENRKSSDRDAEGRRGYQVAPEAITHLTPEQEDEALSRFNANLAQRGTKLRGQLVREVGTPTHILVTSDQNEVVRHLNYEQIIQLYLDRHIDKPTGSLFKSAA